MKSLDHYWYSYNLLTLLALPLSWFFCVLVALRRWAYRLHFFRRRSLPVPVIIVGNITVGGTGKTPMVIWLANYLKKRGWQPGILTRGYRGQAQSWPQQVRLDSDAKVVGDEAVVLARHTGCPVAAGVDRFIAGSALLDHHSCDIILSDDGLQHYALNRDIEIAVVDGDRRFGNGFCLPAGPLREKPRRLRKVDLIATNGSTRSGESYMGLRPGKLVNVRDPSKSASLREFRGQEVVAVAGIGNPQRFFRMLQQHGLILDERPFPDHHGYIASDLAKFKDKTLVMTEKDAVKCMHLVNDDAWYLLLNVHMDSAFEIRLEALLEGFNHG